MRTTKKLLSLLLALCMVVTLLPATVLAAEETTYVAQIGETKYETLEKAVAAVQDGTLTEIELLSNAEGNGIVIPSGRNIIFNLHGLSYTISGNTVGSEGTETNAFQLLKDSNITFKNGKLTSEKAALLIQNYSNLTLDQMVLQGGTDLVVSNNNGKTVIRDTEITASENGAAFDVYSFSIYTGGNVIVEGNSKINGNIQVGYQENASTEDLNLTIKSGTITGAIEQSGNADATFLKENISISGGTFSTDVSAYLDVGCKLENGTVVPDDDSVASIGNKGYETLADAVAAAQGGDTVKLLTDVTIDTWNQVWNTKNLTIDGNNKAITVGKVESNGNGNYLFYGAENLNVSDLTINFKTNGNGFSMVSGKL